MWRCSISRRFFWPSGLSADYDLEAIRSFADPRFWAGCVFVTALAAGGIWAARRPGWRVAGFGALWFLLALLPTSLFPLAETMNDHRAFFPYVGIIIAIGGGSSAALRYRGKWSVTGRDLALAGIVLLLICAGVATYRRNADWKDEESLWKDVTVKSPGNARGLMNYANTQMAKGDFGTAFQYFHRAQALAPHYPTLLINLAVAEGATGDFVKAERDFKDGVRLAPGSSSSYTFYADWLLKEDRLQEALPLITKALEISPGDVYAADLMAKAQRGGESQESTPEGWLNKSLLRYREKRYPESVKAGFAALKLKPDYAEAWNNIGAAYNELGLYEKGETALENALMLKPDFELAKGNLDFARKMEGK